MSYLQLRLVFEEIDERKIGYFEVEDMYNFLDRQVKEDELVYLMRELKNPKNDVIFL